MGGIVNHIDYLQVNWYNGRIVPNFLVALAEGAEMPSQVSISFEDFSGEVSTPTIRTKNIAVIPGDVNDINVLAGDFADLSLCEWQKTRIIYSDVLTGNPAATDPNAQRESIVQFYWQTDTGAPVILKGYVSLPGPNMALFPFVAGGGDTIAPPFDITFVNLNQFITAFNATARDINNNNVHITQLVRTGSSS